MRHAHIVANERAEHQKSWGGAFGEGMRRHGLHVTAGRSPEPCDVLVIWGVRRQDWIAAQKKSGGEVCILERGYLGDRFAWTSVSFGGGLNGRGIFRGPFGDGSRWERHFAHLMRPWRETPAAGRGLALVMGQVPGDQAIKGIAIDDWYRTAAEAYRMAGFETRFRAHPNGGPARPLQADLDEAACVVTWSSNSAVDAVLAGVPTVAMDRGSMAYQVAGHELGTMPPMPDRMAWSHALAWKQWTMQEMAGGDCWAAVGD